MIQLLRKYDKLNSAKLTCYNSLGTCHPGHTFSKFCIAPTKVLIEIIENVVKRHKNRTLQPTIELFSYYLTIMVRIRILVRNSDLSESTVLPENFDELPFYQLELPHVLLSLGCPIFGKMSL